MFMPQFVHALCYIVALFGICSCYEIIKQPESQNVKEGELVTLDCTFDRRVSACYWKLNNNPIAISTYPEDVYELTGDTYKGDCTLSIKNTNFTRDNGGWCCYQPQTVDNLYVDSNVANITIIVYPAGPFVYKDNRYYFRGSKISLLKDVNHNITCLAKHGNPAAALWWKLDNLSSTHSPLREVKFNTTTKLYDVMTTLTLKAVVSMDKSNLSCFMQLLPDINASHTNVQLSVQYDTTTVYLVHELNAVVKEGQQVKFICEADGNPAPTFQWLHKMPHSKDWKSVWNKSVMILSPVKKSDEGNYLCLAGNNNKIPSQESTLSVLIDDALTLSSIIGIALSASAIFIIAVSIGLIYYLRLRISEPRPYQRKNDGPSQFYLDMLPPYLHRVSDNVTGTEDPLTIVQLRKRPPLPSLPPSDDTHDYLIPLPPLATNDEYIIADASASTASPSSVKSTYSRSSSHTYEDPHVYENTNQNITEQ